MSAVVTISAALVGPDAAGLGAEIAGSSAGGREAVRRSLDAVGRVISGVTPGHVRVRVDKTAPAQAVGTIEPSTEGSPMANDYMTVVVPGHGTQRITAIEGTPDPAAGQIDVDAATDTILGAQVAACFAANPFLRKFFTATAADGLVTVTCREDTLPGSLGNGVRFEEPPGESLFDVVSPSGGADAANTPSVTATFGSPDVVQDDTFAIGAVTLTWRNSPSGENQVAASGTPATAAANLVAKINAHSKLRGLVEATRTDAVVTLRWLGDPRSGELVRVARTESNEGAVVLSGSALTSGSTESYGADPRHYTFGAGAQ